MTEPQDPFAPPGAPPPPGHPLTPGAVPVYGAPSPAPPYTAAAAGPPPYGAPLAARRNGLGVAALVLGILAIPAALFGGVPGLLFGVPAIVLGVLGRGRAKRGQADNGGVALAGAITGTIGTVLGLAVLALIVLLVRSNAFERYQTCVDNASGNSAAQNRCGQTLLRDYFR